MDWDIYFLKIATTVSENSKCFSRKIGAVLVRDKAIISTGYNGPPRGIAPCGVSCPRRILGFKSGEGLHICCAGHAERNALIQAARNGISTLNSILYCSCPQPCKDCITEIINAGVKEVVCFKGKEYDSLSTRLITESSLLVRTVDENMLHMR